MNNSASHKSFAQSLRFKRIIIIFADMCSVFLAYLCTLLFRFGGHVPEYPDYMHSFEYTIVPIIILYVAVNAVFHLYNSMWEHASIDELFNVAIACVVSSSLAYLIAVLRGDIMPRSIYIAACLILILLFGSIRLSFRMIRRLSHGRSSADQRLNTLIVGAGNTGALIAGQIQERDDLDIQLIGYVDDDRSKHSIRLHGLKVLGTTDDIARLAKKYSIEQIIFAVPSASANERKRILNICSATGCRLKIIPGLDAMLNGVDIKRMRDVDVEDLLVRDVVHLDLSSISSYLNDSVVMVTGGGGSIGSELCRQIARFGPRLLIIFDIYENTAYELQVDLQHEFGASFPVIVLIGSVRDKQRVEQVMEEYKPDVVFHAAAHKHVPLMETSPAEAVKNNVHGTFTVARAAADAGVKRFVLISTDKAVNPTNIMGATKYLCELIIQYMNDVCDTTRFVAVRFGNVLGSHGSVLPLFRRQIAEGGPITVTHKDVTRYFMTIPEAAQLVIQAGAMAERGQMFILDMGEPVRIDDFARTFIRLSGFEPDVDIKIVYTGLRPGEKLYEELWQDSETQSESGFSGILVGKTHEVSRDEIERRIKYIVDKAYSDPENVHRYIAEVVPTYHEPFSGEQPSAENAAEPSAKKIEIKAREA